MKTIFFTQIGLMTLLGILALIGYADNGIDVGAFFFSIILGALGASISLMRRERVSPTSSTGGDVFDKFLRIMMPILYGTLLSGVAYLLFLSGILSGDGGGGLFTTNLFPNFVESQSENRNLLRQFVEVEPDGMQNTGKLLIWCFMSGYSEKFITNILIQLEDRSQN